jgi:hypothetical protein
LDYFVPGLLADAGTRAFLIGEKTAFENVVEFLQAPGSLFGL